MSPRSRLILHYGRCFLLFLPFALMTISTQGQDQAIDSIQASYTLSDLISRLEQQKTELAQFTAQLQDTVNTSRIGKSIAALTQSVQERVEESEFFLSTYSREWLAQSLMSRWRRGNVRMEALANEISTEIKALEAQLDRNHEWRNQWLATRLQAQENLLITNIRAPIVDLLSDLRAEERLLNQRIRIFLGFQKTVSENRKIITDHTDRLKALIEPDFFTFLNRDGTFLWSQKPIPDSLNVANQLTRTAEFALKDLIDYYQLYARRFFWILVIGVGLYIILHIRKRRLEEVPDQPAMGTLPYVHRQFIYAYTMTLMVSLPILINRPPLLTHLLLLFFTPPLIILIVWPTRGWLRFATFFLVAIYWLYQFADVLVVDRILSRYFDFLHAVLASIFLFILYLKRSEFKSTFPQLYQFTRASFIPYLLFFTSLAVVLQLVGYTLLSRALTSGGIAFAYLAPVILISASIVRDMLKFLEQSSLVRASALARRYYSVLYTALKGVVIYLLFITLITAYSLKPTVNDIVENVWNFGGTFGEFTISVGDVLGFFFIVLVSWTVSVVLQVILEGEILARFDLRRGVAMAVGVLVRYSVMVLGVLAAVASTGFDINKISILAGALGVGIGFGLQNLVANFISGLIIIFERPFVVNDTIESGSVEGTVQQIGIRASKVLTYDGAEVIIPNSELISSRVTNFTLSSRERRFLIIVRTAIQADPEEVIKILNNIARTQELVLSNPAPVVLFEGQSEQSLQFKLYYWIVSGYFEVRTALNVAIIRELKSMGVELPLQAVELRARNAGGASEAGK